MRGSQGMNSGRKQGRSDTVAMEKHLQASPQWLSQVSYKPGVPAWGITALSGLNLLISIKNQENAPHRLVCGPILNLLNEDSAQMILVCDRLTKTNQHGVIYLFIQYRYKRR